MIDLARLESRLCMGGFPRESFAVKNVMKESGAVGPKGRGTTARGASTLERKAARPRRERVLVEFPVNLLQEADEAAAMLEKNRSELIRTALEKYLEEMKKKQLETELAAAYAANAPMNLELAEEFAAVDREGF